MHHRYFERLQIAAAADVFVLCKRPSQFAYFLFISASITAATLAAAAVQELSASSCGLHLAPSSLAAAGRGVIAGRAYAADEDIESVPTLTVPHSIVVDCQLNNYVFGTGDSEFDLVLFGSGSLYNHHINRTVGHYWAEDEVMNPIEKATSCAAYSNFTGNLLRATESVSAGQELFEYYGDSWFEQRAATQLEEPEVLQGTAADTEAVVAESMDDTLEAVMNIGGFCLTDVYIAASTIPGAGKGLFTSRSFEEGEVVTVSPVLTLPREVVQRHSLEKKEQESLLVNYCFGHDDSEVVLMPLGYSPMINHNSEGDWNLNITWFEWEPLQLVNVQRSPQELFSWSFAPLDVAFVATRPLVIGEELFIDYGEEWWELYQQIQQQQHRSDDFDCKNGDLRAFRKYMGGANHLYPSHWLHTTER